MKYAVIGTGKTGQAIADRLPPQDIAALCNSRNPVTLDKLKNADAGIVFVPGPALASLLPLLIESRLPLVIGTTGYPWPADLDAQLRQAGTAWIIGQNFSLGLNVMRYYAQRLKQSLNALRPGALQLGLSETHHIHKLDAPSGTALYIAGALDFPADEIESVREGDAKGTHSVTYGWPHDHITLTHEALDRAAFAEGVLLACAEIAGLEPGLHRFEKLADNKIENSLKG
ncbi:MAG: dihydrodipicolinate reductase C-terminal domain-containing protein [Alphaproteobacteria bacterium]|nr:dihydrodipicolinate reductase C-terminal domain-containing protein [Alphaproteobacteria bacterium]